MDLSVIIPARNEPYLQKTIESLLMMADGDIEVIVVLDGYWPNPPIKDDDKVTLIHFSESKGMRPAINAAARIAKGKYLMKCDAHCHFDESFDTELIKDCEPNWTVVPKRYGLDVENWKRTDNLYEFQYIRKSDLKGKNWPEYGERVKGQQIVDLMTSQGSCWFMHRDYFFKLGGLDSENYGTMGREAQEVCLKTWLSGGRYVLNRNTWYAHWSKDTGLYKDVKKEKQKSAEFALTHWAEEKLLPLIKKFAPVPTWNENMENMENNLDEYIQKKYSLDLDKDIIEINGLARVDMYNIFNSFRFKIGCEIGVWKGENALNILKNVEGVKLYLIDPYKNYNYVRKPRANERISKARKKAHRRIRGMNAKFMEMVSEEAVAHFLDESLDFVYIDAEHTYDMAMLDIILWNRKVKKGGIISGHDYYNDFKHNMEVKSVVNDYARANNIKPIYITDRKADKINEPYNKNAMRSWFWIKK